MSAINEEIRSAAKERKKELWGKTDRILAQSNGTGRDRRSLEEQVLNERRSIFRS